MSRTRNPHLICCSIIAIELIGLGALLAPKSDHGGGETRNSANRATRHPRASTDNEPSAELTNLLATKMELETQIREVRATLESRAGSVDIAAEFLHLPDHWLGRNPLKTHKKTRALLRISDDESRQVDSAVAKALERVRQLELSHLRKEIPPDGSTAFVVEPWAIEGELAMRTLEAELSGALGDSRAAILFREIRASTFLAGGKHTLHLTPRRGPTDHGPFSTGEASSKRLDWKVTDGENNKAWSNIESIWIERENTAHILERYGHILGVETAEGLHELFDEPGQQ